MGWKLGITGMDSASESQLRAAFEQAQSQLRGQWQLVSEADADHVVVDMDSMYGPMSWIRLHAAGKQVIGLTTSPRTQADHRLARPFEPAELTRLLSSIAGITTSAASTGPVIAVTAAQPAPARPPAPAAPVPPPTAAPASPPSAATPAPAPADLLPEEQPIAPNPELAAPPEPAAAIEPAPAVPAAPVPAADTSPTRDRTLADWLAPGALGGRWRYHDADVTLVFDADARVYHGPQLLKPLASALQANVERDALEPLDQAAWSGASSGLGPAQPLARLQWFGGLLAGKGALLPGHDPEGKYRLLKWPQTEREFPRHFRIATAMMRVPATVGDIATASGVPPEDVADFVNANLATGYAEWVSPAGPEPADAPRSTGLLGRLRGR